jgi:rhamnogalacturonyl hydrolase YesR
LFGELGLEESALVFRQGMGLACMYEYYGAKQTLSGDDALAHVMNAYSSEHGVLDIVDLSVQQVDLVTAFSPALKVSKPIQRGQFKSLIKDSFDVNLSRNINPARATESLSKESLFKKFGLAGIDGGK